MAKLILDIKDETKAIIEAFAKKNGMTKKELTLKALAKLIPELKGKY